MTEAKSIEAAIVDCYTYNGRYWSPKSDDMMEHLSRDQIDTNEPTEFKHCGIDRSEDGTLAVFYYSDGSALVVGCSGIKAIGVKLQSLIS